MLRQLFAAALVGAAAGLLSGCDGSGSANATMNQAETRADSLKAEIDALSGAALVARGRSLFAENCAQCHGEAAVGAPDWTRRLPDGSFPPPPLNGTAHAWHHPLAQLRAVIRNGSPSGNMPAWGGRLGEDEITAVIAYFHSLWPEEVHEAWSEMNRRAAR